MREAIAGLPAQFAWAADLAAPRLGAASEVLALGMGGSGFACDAAALFAADTGRVTAHKSYGLPSWAGRTRPLVVATSYSGNTEETLSGAAEAAGIGLPVVAICTGGELADLAARQGFPHVEVPGGLQPRAAAGYLTGAAAMVLEAAGIGAGVAESLREAEQVVGGLLAGGAEEAVAGIAERLQGRVVLAYGGPGVPALAAARWKTQVNENAKTPAWWSALPELDHNEIVGWAAHPALGSEVFGVVALRDSADLPRVSQRMDLTLELMGGVHVAGEVRSQGVGVLARLFSLTVVGDLVSVALAESAGVDPTPVATIENLKRRLAEEPR